MDRYRCVHNGCKWKGIGVFTIGVSRVYMCSQWM